MFVRQAPWEGREEGCYHTTCICYCYSYITHTACCLWLASITAQHSTVQRSTTRTSIFHPHTINIPCCCFCCFPRAIFSSVLRLFSVLNTLHICCASSSANAFALPSVSSPSTFPLPSTCSFSNFPIENVLINMHNLNFEVVERAKETRTEWEWGRGSKCCLLNLIAQSWFANMQFGCRQSEKSFEIFSVMNISISRSAQFWFPKTFITPVCLSPFLSRSLSLSLSAVQSVRLLWLTSSIIDNCFICSSRIRLLLKSHEFGNQKGYNKKKAELKLKISSAHNFHKSQQDAGGKYNFDWNNKIKWNSLQIAVAWRNKQSKWAPTKANHFAQQTVLNRIG